MTQATGVIRNNEERTRGVRPVRARAVAYDGSACLIAGAGDFDLDDLNLVSHRFPGRRVTLDGDLITAWPTPPAGRVRS
ncbi:hypothetical protein ACH4PR_41060 [Streptomyces mirabilis]|uniref:hypothetical protein n=1 Tax=Streptomyces mirabilis TaxID=68239 RepID=UPI0037A95157